MIIKASQRGNAEQLAAHLLNTEDNEHITLHEVRGFLSDDLRGALLEANALSKGTRCKQFLFSVSLSPPENEIAKTGVFDDAIAQIEERMHLNNQPRVVVFHEKKGRRHAHAVWSRIDGQSMTAINLPFYKNRMTEIAKSLYLKHGWNLPRGFIDRELRNPLNFSREQWQQAKRLQIDPRIVKAGLQHCWKTTKNKTTFSKVIEKRGYYLARGDKRGYVLVDWRGEVLSLTRWLGVKTKAAKERLADPKELPTVQQVKASIDQALVKRTRHFTNELKQRHARTLKPLHSRIKIMKDHHKNQRQDLARKQELRQVNESKQRQSRLKTGLRGVWSRIIGEYGRTKKQNEIEACQSLKRDRDEKDRLVLNQLTERKPLQRQLNQLQTKHDKEIMQCQSLTLSGEQPEPIINNAQPERENEPVSPKRSVPGYDLKP